jgi:hypothetical protein
LALGYLTGWQVRLPIGFPQIKHLGRLPVSDVILTCGKTSPFIAATISSRVMPIFCHTFALSGFVLIPLVTKRLSLE